VLSNTVGLAFRAVTGNVDPWTLQQQKDQIAADTAQALGPDATDADIATAQTQAQAQVDSYLKANNAHPDQAGVRLPGLGVIGTPEFLAKLEKLVYGAIAVGALIGLFYFSQKYGSSIKKTFEKK
jgi:hypothetical protein